MPAPDGGAAVSPLSITFPPEADVHWTSAGRRIALVLSASGGLERAAAGGSQLLTGSWVIGGANAMSAGSLVVTPTDVRRVVRGGIEERWTTALELPLFFWELEPGHAGVADVEAELADGWARSEPGFDAAASDAALRFADGAGRLLVVSADGSGAELRVVPADGGQRLSAKANGRLRLSVIAAQDPADLDRTLELLARRGFSGLRAQRVQHARLVRDYGTALSTPSPALDQAFEWAKLRADELPPSPTARAEALSLDAILDRPEAHALADPSGFLEGVLHGLWGVEAHAEHRALTLAPRLPGGWTRMGVSRLRVGSTAVDCAMSRRAGQVTLRLRRRTGPAVAVALSLPGVSDRGLAIDGVPLGGREARFEAAGEHEVSFDLAE